MLYPVFSRDQWILRIKIKSCILENGRFPLLRILNTTTSMLFGGIMQLSMKYPLSIMYNKGNRLLTILKAVFHLDRNVLYSILLCRYQFYMAKNAPVPGWWKQASTMLCCTPWTLLSTILLQLFMLTTATYCWQQCSWSAAQHRWKACFHQPGTGWAFLAVYPSMQYAHGTKKYATFRYDTGIVENSLKPVFHFTRIVAKRSVFLCSMSTWLELMILIDTKENATVRYDTGEVENRL